MLHVGLTGSIGSGKSTVDTIFAEQGAHVIDADVVAHQLMTPGTVVYQRVTETFGAECIRPDGTIDRRRLGAIIFASREKRELLNGIVHPAVRTDVLRQIVELEQSFQAGIVIVDAALMVESGFYRLFEKVIVVTCTEALQIARITSRDGLSAEEARVRIATQMPVAEKLKVAHYSIDTSGTLRETRDQAEAVYRDLMQQERRLRAVE